MKIQTTVKVYDVVELDIQLPYYCKNDDSFFCVESEEDVTDVCLTTHGYTRISKCSLVERTKEEITKSTSITRREFEAAKQKALAILFPEQVETPVVDREEDPNIYHETLTEERLFDEQFQNELYEREEGLS
jgi:hypothetical protein